MAKDVTMSVRLEDEDAKRLKKLAAATPMSRSTVLRLVARIGMDVVGGDVTRLVKPRELA